MSNWFLIRDGREEGSFDDAQLRKFASDGILSPNDLVRRDGMSTGVPAKTVNGLFAPRSASTTTTLAANEQHRSIITAANCLDRATSNNFRDRGGALESDCRSRLGFLFHMGIRRISAGEKLESVGRNGKIETLDDLVLLVRWLGRACLHHS